MVKGNWENASEETLENIEQLECDNYPDLSTKRFRRLFNEIKHLTTEWIDIHEESPPLNTFVPLWVNTNRGVFMARFYGDGNGRSLRLVDGFASGVVFESVTHWAHIIVPDPPK